jgi:aryl-alcohol dehydrogenase-like predicted oxidoreductase
MKNKPLGRQGLQASQLGLGCMGMSEFYGPTNEAENLRTLERALELGINFLDTSDAYGPHKNEVLVGKFMKDKREKILLATKFGIVRDPNNPAVRGLNGKPEYVTSACDASLKRLNTDYIDLYYLHRVDPSTPIELTVEAMSKLVSAGKIKGLGLSEVSPETLRKAHAIHPISAVQSEYSLWSREPEHEMLETCKELGVAFVAYSPLGRGFLTGQIKKFEDLAEDDWRRHAPRFQGENFQKNLDIVSRLTELARRKGCTPSQLALAWVLTQDENIFPIPGTKRVKYLEENVAALNISFTSQELAEIDAIAPHGIAIGNRYPDAMMKTINQ